MDDETRGLLIKHNLLFARTKETFGKITCKLTAYEDSVYIYEPYQFKEEDWFKNIVGGIK